jgi:hypothetical protein
MSLYELLNVMRKIKEWAETVEEKCGKLIKIELCKDCNNGWHGKLRERWTLLQVISKRKLARDPRWKFKQSWLNNKGRMTVINLSKSPQKKIEPETHKLVAKQLTTRKQTTQFLNVQPITKQ